MNIKLTTFVSVLLLYSVFAHSQNHKLKLVDYDSIITGAEQISAYLPIIKNKNIVVVANQASTIGKKHIVDTLLSCGVNISSIFSPEHGFRGIADAGKKIDNKIDSKTNIKIVSLYGSHRKPTANDLQDIDIVVFDLQDVGVRFFTYSSTMTLVMEACAENNVPIIVLDRPNPNAYFIDGPVLKKENSSFVGMHPVPVVYGMTIGEYALMIVGEKWINKSQDIDLKIIKLKKWDHNTIVKLKIKPSPNLPNWQSIYLYPSLCFFEGTVMSVGRGTDLQFQVYGKPNFKHGDFEFTPTSKPGATNPKYNNNLCRGYKLDSYAENYTDNPHKLNISWLINAYKHMDDSTAFFNGYFDKLAGNKEFRDQIINGLSENSIRKSWQHDLNRFKIIRKKYLLYP